MKILPKKSLGQNFLIDNEVLNMIAELGKINSNDVVLEIGPGTGNLTEKILKKKNNGFKTRVFSKNEIMYCEKKNNPFPFYAKRYAAKEALSKALGTGIRKGVNFKDIEVSNNLNGKPSIKLKGETEIFLLVSTLLFNLSPLLSA